MEKISYLLTGVTMFMIMFGFTLLSYNISEDKTIMLVITFTGVSIAVFLAYPLLQIFDSFYDNDPQVRTDT